MSPMYIENHIKYIVKTLAAINVLEPVNENNLSKAVSNITNKGSLKRIISELINDGLVAKEGNLYRVTQAGLTFRVSRRASKLRDISRMKHLLAISKQRGGDTFGR